MPEPPVKNIIYVLVEEICESCGGGNDNVAAFSTRELAERVSMRLTHLSHVQELEVDHVPFYLQGEKEAINA